MPRVQNKLRCSKIKQTNQKEKEKHLDNFFFYTKLPTELWFLLTEQQKHWTWGFMLFFSIITLTLSQSWALTQSDCISINISLINIKGKAEKGHGNYSVGSREKKEKTCWISNFHHFPLFWNYLKLHIIQTHQSPPNIQNKGSFFLSSLQRGAV